MFTDVFMVPSPELAPLRDDGKYLGRAKPLKTPGEIVTSVIPRVTPCLHLFGFPVFSFPSTWFGVKTQGKIFYFHNGVL